MSASKTEFSDLLLKATIKAIFLRKAFPKDPTIWSDLCDALIELQKHYLGEKMHMNYVFVVFLRKFANDHLKDYLNKYAQNIHDLQFKSMQQIFDKIYENSIESPVFVQNILGNSVEQSLRDSHYVMCAILYSFYTDHNFAPAKLQSVKKDSTTGFREMMSMFGGKKQYRTDPSNPRDFYENYMFIPDYHFRLLCVLNKVKFDRSIPNNMTLPDLMAITEKTIDKSYITLSDEELEKKILLDKKLKHTFIPVIKCINRIRSELKKFHLLGIVGGDELGKSVLYNNCVGFKNKLKHTDKISIHSIADARVLKLLLLARKFDLGSFFYKDKFPQDMFNIILRESNLLGGHKLICVHFPLTSDFTCVSALSSCIIIENFFDSLDLKWSGYFDIIKNYKIPSLFCGNNIGEYLETGDAVKKYTENLDKIILNVSKYGNSIDIRITDFDGYNENHFDDEESKKYIREAAKIPEIKKWITGKTGFIFPEIE